MTATLSGMLLARTTGLPTLLVHNNERLQELCSRLTTSDKSEERLASVQKLIEELHECQTLSLGVGLEENLETLFSATKLMVRTYLDSAHSTISGLDEKLNYIRDSNHRDHDALIEAAKAGEQAIGLLRKFVRQENKGQENDEIMLRFFEFAARPAVAVECHRRKRTSVPDAVKADDKS